MASKSPNKNVFILLVFLLLFVYIGAVVYIQYFLNPTFYTDQRIYQDAASKIVHGQNPYLPFRIPVSFVYPPAILPIFAVFNSIPFDVARVIWLDISLICYLAALGIMWNWLKPAATLRTALIFALMFFYGPLSENLTVGQVDTVILLGLSLFIWSLASNRYTWAGSTGLALATLIKFTPGMLGLILIKYHDWSRSWKTFVAGLLIASISALTFGLKVWESFISIIPQLVVSGSSDQNNQRITTSIARLFNTAEDDRVVRTFGSFFSITVIGIWLFLLLFKSSKDNLLPISLLGIVVLTISSSLIWYHHFLFLIIPILYLLIKYEQSNLRWLGWFGLMAIQVDRVLEHALKWPPIVSVTGYLLIFTATIILCLERKEALQSLPDAVPTDLKPDLS